jgi:hypothetical protein
MAMQGLVAGTLLVLVSAGCSSSGVDASCDVDGVSHEVEHILDESKLQLTSLETLRCSGTWAFARATVAREGQSPQAETFLFKKTEAGWFLKAPEIACGNDPGLEVVSEELRADACAGVSSS